jgi:hypothetical protein
MKLRGFSFCETVIAGPLSRWHIRPLTEKGKKLGGGADTVALCGKKVAWDLNVDITDRHLEHCCPQCAKAYKNSRADMKLYGFSHDNR